MVKKTIIGNRPELVGKKRELPDWAVILAEISGKTLSQVEKFCDTSFSGLDADARAGLKKVVRVVWAITKILRRFLLK